MPVFYQWVSVGDAKVSPGWQIFDRELTTPEGQNLRIAWAVTRKVAIRITKALNTQEQTNAKGI